MSIQKPTAAELAFWDTQIDSVDRAISKNRLVYGVGDNMQAFNTSWRKAELHQPALGKPKGRKSEVAALVAHCENCGRSFTARKKDARNRWCKDSCRVKKSRSVRQKSQYTYAERNK